MIGTSGEGSTMGRIYLSVWILLLVCLIQAAAKCKFPKEWKGRWYQGGLGEVTIKSSSIIPKGVCVEHHRDLFLVENKEGNCFQCLLMLKQHRNIIQYKESYCIAKDSLHNICSNIRVEAVLYTLVREPHAPIKCPFQDAYYFDYNDNMYGFCDNPISYAKPCAGDSRFRFHFKHCVPMAYMNGKDLDFECIATWKDGSEMYLYGKFSGPTILSQDDSYRCFKYQAYGTEVFMAMSADATCWGMRTYSDGPVVMKFDKDIFGWPQPNCDFPDWFTAGEIWRDLSERHILEPDYRKKGTITLGVKKRPDSKDHVKSEIRCIEVLHRNETAREYLTVSFTSSGCLSKHQCIWMKELGPNAVEVKLGGLVDFEEAKRCTAAGENYEEKYTFITPSQSRTSCPMQGRYRVLYGSADCPGDVIVGCNQTNEINIRCSAEQHGTHKLECLGYWQQDNKTYTIATTSDADGRQLGCMPSRELGETIEYYADMSCPDNVPNLLPMSLTVHSVPGRCEDVQSNVVYGEDDSSSNDFVSSKEGQYQHVEGKGRKKTSSRETSGETSPPSAADTLTSSCLLLILPSTLALLIQR